MKFHFQKLTSPISSQKKKSERFSWFLMLKNDFESMNFAIFEEVVYNFCWSDNGLMPNFIKKSWTVSQGDVICFSDRNSCCNVNNIFEKFQICIFHELELLFECGENSIRCKDEYSFRNNFIPLGFFWKQSLKCDFNAKLISI